MSATINQSYSNAIRQISLAGSRTYPGPQGIQASLIPGAGDMHSTFGYHRNHVCEISFEGMSANFNKFFEVTNCPFPVLESLVLNFKARF
jgi:hypothetical protein